MKDNTMDSHRYDIKRKQDNQTEFLSLIIDPILSSCNLHRHVYANTNSVSTLFLPLILLGPKERSIQSF